MLDFTEAFNYYNNISITLGLNFYNKFEQAIHKLSLSPYNYYNLTKKLRRIRLGKFPYMIVYKISGSTVIAAGLFHQSSKPSKWRKVK
jgi:hypothetical protein